jgi:metal-responsive CopG/Arc/MetJ family transcriptional regulator
MTDHSNNRITVWMADALTKRVDERVDWKYGSRSQFVREAVEYRMILEEELARQGIELPEDEADRERMLRDIALAGVDAVADEQK